MSNTIKRNEHADRLRAASEKVEEVARKIEEDLSPLSVAVGAFVTKEKKLIEERARDVIVGYIRSATFDGMVKVWLGEAARDVVAELLAARLPELDARVRALIEEKFEAAVEKTAREQLDAALVDVRRRFAKGGA